MHYDLAIIGGGLAGMTLAALCGASGLKVACIDQNAPNAPAPTDERTTAISYGSREILKEAGIWEFCAPHACPIRDIRILDGAGSRVLLNFLSEDVEGRDFGWIIENAILRAAALKRLAALPSVTLIAPASAGNFALEADVRSCTVSGHGKITASLLIGADGRASPLREALGIDTRGWNYHQRALAAIIGHENPHDNVAVEHFFASGPFAVLPMLDAPDGMHRSAIVLTEHGPEAQSLIQSTPDVFLAAVEARLPPYYGAISVRTPPKAFPLNLVHAAAYTAPRAALIGDAAHGIHPVAGQGLNLGFRDVKTLSGLINAAHAAKTDIGSEELLEAYARARRADVTAMAAFTDGIVRLFSNDIAPVRALRKLGLRAVGRLPAAKRFFMRKAMGE